jgi:hypothetical protein
MDLPAGATYRSNLLVLEQLFNILARKGTGLAALLARVF